MNFTVCLKWDFYTLLFSFSVKNYGYSIEKLRFSYTGQENKEEEENFIKEGEGKKNLTNIVGRFSLNRQILSKKIKKKFFESFLPIYCF